MNINELHSETKSVSAMSLFKGALGNVTAIQILQGEKLKEHITTTPAILLCVQGEVLFENEKGLKEKLLSGDYVNIDSMVKHWVGGEKDSQLILIK